MDTTKTLDTLKQEGKQDFLKEFSIEGRGNTWKNNLTPDYALRFLDSFAAKIWKEAQLATLDAVEEAMPKEKDYRIGSDQVELALAEGANDFRKEAIKAIKSLR